MARRRYTWTLADMPQATVPADDPPPPAKVPAAPAAPAPAPVEAAARQRRPVAERRGRQPEPGLGGVADGLPARLDDPCRWPAEPTHIPRVAAGVPDRVARLRALGNAVVPQVVAEIGRAILAAEAETRRVA